MNFLLNSPKRALFTAFMLILMVVSGCSPQSEVTEEDVVGVRKVMEDRAKAIAAKNITAYAAVFFDEYNERSVTKAQLVDDMAQKFEKHATIKLTYQRSPVEVKFNTARVVSRISYEVAGFEKPIYDQETLTFRRINDRWVIAGGVNPNLF